MSARDRWGTSIRLTADLRAGQPGIPAIALHPPFGTWVATGRRQHKYLSIAPGKGTLFYLYHSLRDSPEDWWLSDWEDWEWTNKRGKGDDAEASERDFRAIIARDSRIRGAIVGVASLGVWERGDKIWEFAGGRLLPEPIPRERFARRPGQGVFYPFGREAP